MLIGFALVLFGILPWWLILFGLFFLFKSGGCGWHGHHSTVIIEKEKRKNDDSRYIRTEDGELLEIV